MWQTLLPTVILSLLWRHYYSNECQSRRMHFSKVCVFKIHINFSLCILTIIFPFHMKQHKCENDTTHQTIYTCSILWPIIFNILKIFYFWWIIMRVWHKNAKKYFCASTVCGEGQPYKSKSISNVIWWQHTLGIFANVYLQLHVICLTVSFASTVQWVLRPSWGC